MSVVSGTPKYTCQLCLRRVDVVPSGRGFPPDKAKKKLIKECKAAGCDCSPVYTAGYFLVI